MKLAVLALCTAAAMACAPAVLAQGTSNNAPGHEVQKVGKKTGRHVASQAPRRRMQATRSKTGYPGASEPVEVRDITDIATKGGGGGGGRGY